MGEISEAARLRRDWNHPSQPAASRAACWVCGLRQEATTHGDDAWWQHEYVPGILTRVR